MTPEQLLSCLNQAPGDEVLWLALADRLEEEGQLGRAELARLGRRLRGMAEDEGRWAAEDRVRELIDGGVAPCVPEVVNSIGMRLVLIPPGTFWMGSPEDEAERYGDEKRHLVTLTWPMWLGAFPVTQGQYEAVMGSNPSHFSAAGGGSENVAGLATSAFPVESVSWEDAVAFCERLSSLPGEKACGREYRLPTEAEWEHACRGGLFSKPFHFGDQLNGTQANCDGNYPHGTDQKGPYLERTCAVGSYRPNAWGLYDMHGNVWEWCSDWYDAGEYAGREARGPRDPQGPQHGPGRVLRGGSWGNLSAVCRAASRGNDEPGNRHDRYGFRVCVRPG